MQMLLLSATLNVGLFTTFLYRSLSPKPVAWENPEKKTFEVTNGEMIYSYFHCSFDELVEKRLQVVSNIVGVSSKAALGSYASLWFDLTWSGFSTVLFAIALGKVY
mgnify:CR=1 FL=1